LALQELKQFEEALSSYDIAIALKADYADAYNNRGLALTDLRRFAEALESYRKAIEIKLDFSEAYVNKGNLLRQGNKYEDALYTYEKAIELKPNNHEAYICRAVVLEELNRFDEALSSYDMAIALKPDLAEAYANKSLTLLKINQYEQAWAIYDWRWKKQKRFVLTPFTFIQPLWQGAQSGKKLLVWGEQGVGDQVLYGGLLPELMDYPQGKLVALDKRLLPLFRRSIPELEFMDLEQLKDDTGFEEQIPMGSLPRLFRPNRKSFERVKSPYLVADTARVQELRQLVQRPGRGVCGVSWSSKREEIGQGKSISLAQMLGPLANAGMHFVNLQYGDTQKECEALGREHGIELQNVAEVDNFADIDGLAALIEACDVVVTTSNTTAHLAGALGKQTLLLLPLGRSRLWYWGHEQDRSIWYPSVRIYGQEQIGHWQHPLAGIKRYLENELCR
jgi:lipoprotein NlpI